MSMGIILSALDLYFLHTAQALGLVPTTVIPILKSNTYGKHPTLERKSGIGLRKKDMASVCQSSYILTKRRLGISLQAMSTYL